MKNRILSLMALVTLMGAQTHRVMAQVEVRYPNQGYWNWEIPCNEELKYFHGYESANILPLDNYNEYDPSGTRTCLVNPYDAREQRKTIYGAALSLKPEDVNWYTDPVTPMTNGITFDIIVYSATPGDSVVEEIKRQTFVVEKGQHADVVMVYPEYYNSNEVVKYQMFEFYFDNPVVVDGLTYIGVQSSDLMILMYGKLQYRYMGHTDGSCCFWGYRGVVETEKQMLIAYQTNGDCFNYRSYVGNTTTPYGVSAPLPDTVHTIDSPIIVPIIKPRGYLSTTLQNEIRDVRLWPNPAWMKMTVEADETLQSVELTDMTGRTVMTQKCDGGTLSATLDIAPLPQGIYMVKVRTAQGVATRKLVIE